MHEATHIKECFHVYGYADHIATVVGGHFLTTLSDLMENTLTETHRWCKTKGMVVNPQKTNVMLFIRKYKPEPTEPLRLEGKEI
jgi:hypothetical protein